MPDDRALRLLDLLARQAADMIEHTQNQAALRMSKERMDLALGGLGVRSAFGSIRSDNESKADLTPYFSKLS